jgi:hypothetical protein
MHNDQIIYSLIATCRTANQNWMIEQEKPEERRAGGRSGPPSPQETTCKAFIDASEAMEKAVPRTLEGFVAKWEMFFNHEKQYEGWSGASDLLGFMGRMLTDIAPLVVAEERQDRAHCAEIAEAAQA